MLGKNRLEGGPGLPAGILDILAYGVLQGLHIGLGGGDLLLPCARRGKGRPLLLVTQPRLRDVEQGAAEHLSPSQRMSDSQNWETIEFILEGTIFLTMGLEMHALVNDLHDGTATGILSAVGIAALMLVAFTLLRPGFWWDMIYPPLSEVKATRLEQVMKGMTNECMHCGDCAMAWPPGEHRSWPSVTSAWTLAAARSGSTTNRWTSL